MFQIKHLIANELKPSSGFINYAPEIEIPIIIESYYSFNGLNQYDKSLYVLDMDAVISDNRTKPKVTVNGIKFIEKLPLQTSIQTYLDDLWTKRNIEYSN
ncbi:MAG: hypothetical protein AB7E76_13970 [Deferribacterales bacterium]